MHHESGWPLPNAIQCRCIMEISKTDHSQQMKNSTIFQQMYL